MQHLRTSGLDFLVELLDRICFERNLWPILRSVFRALDHVSFCAVTFDYGKILIPVENPESQAMDEQVESLVQCVVEDFWNEP